MKQNIYDDAEFFAKYSAMPRSVGGLNEAAEWPVFRGMLPDLRDKRLLDLGCGFGWHCRYAREAGARSVVGVDISGNMLTQARAASDDDGIEYRLSAIEDADFPPSSFDVVISSLAFHYVERFDLICEMVYRTLIEGGAFVFSVEHPIFTSLPSQQWCLGPNGERLHWAVDDYQQEGIRHTQWLADDVVKYHRTMATLINTLIGIGFRIERLSEAPVTPEMLAEHPEFKDDCRRPTFLLIAAIKD